MAKQPASRWSIAGIPPFAFEARDAVSIITSGALA